MSAALQTLMQWFSPAYPVGGFAYSHGLEYAISAGEVHDSVTARDWIGAIIREGAGRNDAILLAHAWRGEDVSELAEALAGSAERHRETMEQGAAFARITSAVAVPVAAQAYPVAVGRAAAANGLPLDLTLLAFVQAFAANLIAAAVKFVPLGQTAGQLILRDLLPDCAAVAGQAQSASLDDLGGSVLRADLSAMRHETMTTRIFRT